jgi:photosystem II stability/assembly factor-like uncharacterized protein
MRKLFFILSLLSVLFFQESCNNDQSTSQEPESEEHENEDGIAEAQLMEFELTKDLRLGYVPAFRLVNAYNEILTARRAGRYENISALSWVERGPNNNTLGPSNGNTRGPGNNAVVSGRMRAIHVDLNDVTNKTVWAASVSGGLWKTTDITASPANWILVNDFLGNLAITSITQDPVNRNILYFGTGERNNNVDAVRGGGVWKSIDAGVTWSLIPNTAGFWNISKIACDAAGNLYVGTNGNNQGLQRTTNGGTSWSNITPTNAGNSNRITDIKISSTGRLHVTMSGTTEAGSYFTDNPSTVASGTWSVPITPITGLSLNCEIAVAGNVLYALPEVSGGFTPQIFKSTDGGTNWAPTPTSPPSTGAEPSINLGQGWYDLALGVDPNNPDICVAGGLNFYRTTDGGTTWTQITRWVGTTLNYVHADHHGVFWNGTQVLLATDGGIFYSNNNGLSYSDRNVGMRTLQFYSCALHPTNNFYLGGTQDNGSHSLTSTGPVTGSIEVHGGDGGYTHIDEDEPQFQYSATTRSNYRRSTNGGVNWSSVSFGNVGQFINPTDYDDVNNRMYCSGNAGTFVRWNNAQTGTTFSTINLPSTFASNTIRSLKVSPYTSNRVFMGTGGGGVLRVDNADLDAPIFTHINLGVGMPAGVVSCVNTGTNDNFLIATYSTYGVQKVHITSNGGTTWTNVNGNLPDIPVRWAMYYPENNSKAIIATDMGIFETDNLNGSSTVWVQNATFPNVKTNMLQYRISDGTILAATHGRGFWTTQVTATAPFVRFGSSYNYSKVNTETTSATTSCRNYRDYTLPMYIDAAPTGDANVTINIASGNAVEGVDYDITTNGSFTSPSKQLTFPSGQDIDRTITIRVYDDAEVENQESFTINYTIGSGTNAVPSGNSTTYTFYLGDNDTAPTGGSTFIETVLNSTRTADIRSNGTYYFYSSGNRIISRIENAANILGCATFTINEAGNTWQTFLNGTRSQKVFDVSTASNSGTTYSIGLYLTSDELGGKTPGTLQITVTTAATLNDANASNTFKYLTLAIPFGTDYLFTSNVPSFANAKYFLTEGVTTSLFDLNRIRDQFAQLLLNPVSNQIPLLINNEDRKKVSAILYTQSGAVVKRWDAGTVNGNVSLSMQNLYILPGTYFLRLDAGIKTQTFKLVKN